MAGGNPEVGRVSIRVTPKLKGFREDVERQMAGLKDQTIDIDPNLAGFRQKIKNATKGMKASLDADLNTSKIRKQARAATFAASGEKVLFDSELAGIALTRKAKQAAKRASGHTIQFDSVMVNRFFNRDLGFKKELPGLKKDLQFLNDSAKSITLEPLQQSAQKAGNVLKRIGNITRQIVSPATKATQALKRVTGGYKIERQLLNWFSEVRSRTKDVVGRNFTKGLKAVGESARITGHDMYVAGQAGIKPFRDRMKQVQQQSVKAKEKLRQVNLELHNMKKYGRDGIDPAQESAKGSIDWIDDEVQALRKLSTARKAFNRNKVGKGYDPKLHLEYQKLADAAKKLRGANPIEAFDQVKDITSRLQKMQRQLGASGDSMEYVAVQLGAVENRHKRLQKSLKSRSTYLKHPELRVLISGMEKAEVAAKKFRTTMQKVGDSSRNAFGKMQSGFNNSKLRRDLEFAGGSFIAFGRKVQDTKKRIGDFGITGMTRKMTPAVKRIQSVSDAVTGLRARVTGLPGVLKKADKSFDNFFSKISNRTKKNKGGYGKRTILGLTRTGWLVSAIASIAAPLIGLVSGALGALPALGGAALAVLGATVLGWEGIKDAASAAAPAVDRAKEALSDVFRERLTPQFEQLGGALDSVRGNLVGMANGMSDFSQGFVDAVSGTKGISNIKELIDNTGEMFSDMKPFAKNFTGALLEMGAAGSRSFEKLSEGLNGWSEDFAESVTKMSEDGSLQRAVEGTFDILGSLGTNLGEIIGAGIRELPNMVDSTTHLFDGLGDGISDLLPLFGELSNTVFNTLGTLASELGTLGERITPGMTDFLEGITPGLQELVSGTGDLAGSVLEPVSNFLGGLGPGMGDTLTMLGDGFSSLAGGIDKLSAGDAEGKINGLNSAMQRFGTTAGEFLPAMFGQYNDAVDELKDPNADDYSGFSGLLSFSADQYLHDLKKGTADISDWLQNGSTEISEASKKFTQDVQLSGEEISAGLSEYGNGFTRFMEYGFKFNDLGHVAASEIGKIQTFGVSISEAISNAKDGIQQAMDTTSIDLTPQIKKLDAAKTEGEIREVLTEVQEILRGSNITESAEISIEVRPEPKLAQDLGMERFGALQQKLLESVQAMPPAEVEAKMNVKPQFTFEEGTISAGLGDFISGMADRMREQSAADLSAAASEAGTNTKAAFDQGVSGIGDAVEVEFQLASQSIDTSMAGVTESISSGMTTAKTTAQTESSGIGTTIMSALSGLPGRVGGIFGSLASAMTGQMSGAAGSVTGSAAGMAGSVIGSAGGMSGSVIGYFASMAGGMISSIAGAAGNVISSIAGMVAQSVATIAQLPGQAVAALSGVGGMLVASGVALVQGFINGIRSMIGAVAAAASEVAAAARDYFPFSPAKKGPFSGRGYTTYSGVALVTDFAKGMQSQTGAVESAAAAVAGAAQKRFNTFSLNPSGFLEDFHRNEILQPVLESNAKKIHDYRKREAESAERLAERIKDINESDSKEAKKEERIAEARKKAAEQSAEAKKKLLESIEAPEYGDIDRSIQSYYIDGMKKAMTQGLVDSMEEVDLAGRTRKIALAAVSEARRVFGSHPLFDQAEASVTADHFADTLQRVIEESGIAEIPVNFAISNLDQLKSDLGMSDGVVSRALDLAISTDPANTDARYARQNKQEIHYHVKDMEEAIRLEQQRERKETLKIK